MKFPTSFTRYKGTGTPTLGSDSVPTDPLAAPADNVIFSRFSNVNGWPVQRIVVGYKYVGLGSPVTLTGDMYIWEDTTQSWYLINASPVSLVAGKLSFFDTLGLLDMPNVLADIGGANAGSIVQMLIVTDPGTAPDGAHIFAMAPDMTSPA